MNGPKGADSDVEELENLKRSLSQVMGKEKLERQQSKVISIKSSHKTRSSMFSATRWVISIIFSELSFRQILAGIPRFMLLMWGHKTRKVKTA